MKLIAVVSAALIASVASFAPATQNTRFETSLFGRKAFITGNWKMNPSTKDEAVALATGIANAVTSSSPGDVALFVPYPYLESVSKAVDGKLTIGAEVSLRLRHVCQDSLVPLPSLSGSSSLLLTEALSLELCPRLCSSLLESLGPWQVTLREEPSIQNLTKTSTSSALS